MGRIVVHEFITLDGVIDNPAWAMEYGFDPKMGGAIARIMGPCKALLIGRNTYELFAPTWSTRTAAEDPGAPFMNESPKYVVSSTMQNGGWNNSTILGAYDAQTIRSLKQRIEGDLYVSGSGTLVRAMLADGLVDELHLFVFPLSLGAGPRLFSDGVEVKFSLAETESYDNGALRLVYRPVRWRLAGASRDRPREAPDPGRAGIAPPESSRTLGLLRGRAESARSASQAVTGGRQARRWTSRHASRHLGAVAGRAHARGAACGSGSAARGASGSAADDTQSSGGLSGVVDSPIAFRRGDESAHRAPPVTRKEPQMSISTITTSTSSLRRTTIVVAAIGAAATTVAAITMRAVGVHLAAGGRIPLGAFAQLTFAGGLLGGLLVALLNRRSVLPRRRFIQIAVALTALSCVAPAVGGDDLASKIGLIAIHVLAATIIAPVLARHMTR